MQNFGVQWFAKIQTNCLNTGMHRDQMGLGNHEGIGEYTCIGVNLENFTTFRKTLKILTFGSVCKCVWGGRENE